jgi:hypothetical protein
LPTLGFSGVGAAGDGVADLPATEAPRVVVSARDATTAAITTARTKLPMTSRFTRKGFGPTVRPVSLMGRSSRAWQRSGPSPEWIVQPREESRKTLGPRTYWISAPLGRLRHRAGGQDRWNLRIPDYPYGQVAV